MEEIAIKRVIFHSMPDFIYSVESWVANGGYKGFLKDNSINIFDIKKIENGFMSFDKFYSLPTWEG